MVRNTIASSSQKSIPHWWSRKPSFKLSNKQYGFMIELVKLSFKANPLFFLTINTMCKGFPDNEGISVVNLTN